MKYYETENVPSLAALSVVVSATAALRPPTAPAKPNIIFILADDYGIGEVGCYGADNYKTPNIDALAKGGIRYTHAYIDAAVRSVPGAAS